MAGEGVTDKDKKRIKLELKDINKFISEIEKMGGEVPAPLKKSLKHLETAINTGKDIAAAAEAASKNLRAYEKDLQGACKTVDEELQGVCEAGVARQYMARGVKWTLDPKMKEGVISKFIKKTVQRYTPQKICKNWDYCAKEEKKAGKK